MIMSHCHKCKKLDIQYEDFIDFQFRAFFAEEDTNHLYNLRKEFDVTSNPVSNVWNLLKPFGYYWANIWDATVEDYISSHFFYSLTRRHER